MTGDVIIRRFNGSSIFTVSDLNGCFACRCSTDLHNNNSCSCKQLYRINALNICKGMVKYWKFQTFNTQIPVNSYPFLSHESRSILSPLSVAFISYGPPTSAQPTLAVFCRYYALRIQYINLARYNIQHLYLLINQMIH